MTSPRPRAALALALLLIAALPALVLGAPAGLRAVRPVATQPTASAAASLSRMDPVTFNTAGTQTYTVPTTGLLTIRARGADGGDAGPTRAGGSGATVEATFQVITGDVITVVVGEPGGSVGANTISAGGGGGTALIRTSSVGGGRSLLLVAGAGGGGGRNPGGGGGLSSDGTPGGGTSGGTGGGGGGGFNAAGTAGGGGGGGAGTIASGAGVGGTAGTNGRAGGSGFGGGGGGAQPNIAGGGGGGGGYSGGRGGGTTALSARADGGTSFVGAAGTDVVRTDGAAVGGSQRAGEVVLSGPATAPPTAVVVDTNADDQTYTPATSLASCTDRIPDGDCTLREALEVANATASITTVAFNVGSTYGADANGVATITVASALPAVTRAGLTIDGYSQFGSVQNTLAVGSDAVLKVALRSTAVSPARAAFDGITLAGTGQTVRGLSIGGFERGIFAAPAAESAVIVGTFVGIGTDGATGVANTIGIGAASSATGLRIGTNGDGAGDAAERNVVSGNAAEGISLLTTTGAVVAGNYVGLNAAGTAAVGNVVGIAVQDGSAARIGTNGDGAGDAAEANVVSGNTQDGIDLRNTLSAVVAGNYVGLDAAGTAAVGNRNGIRVQGGSAARIGTNSDGTSDAAERNVASGNRLNGIALFSTASTVVAGNSLGLNAAGTAAVGNANAGIAASEATSLRIGTDSDGTGDAAERNVISGNNQLGLALIDTPAAVVAGNYVGLNAAGTAAVGNRFGISVSGNVPVGPRIGSNGDGIRDGAEANVISGNTAQGVAASTTPTVMTLLGNAISRNGAPPAPDEPEITRLGIDLGFDGVTLNDAGDGDIGPNGLQNFPVITAASQASVAFTLNSTASTTFRVEAFASAAADPSGYGEGARVVGFTNVTTDAQGNATGTVTPTGLVNGEFVALTATPVTVDAQGAVTGFPARTGTSEFSLAVQAAAAGVTQASSIFNPTSAPGDGAGYRLLGAPVDGYTIDRLAGLNLVQGVAAGSATPAQYPTAGHNVFPAYAGAGSYPRPAATDVVLAPGRGFFWYLYDRTIPASSGFGGGTSASRELTGFAFSATGTSPTADVSVPFADNAADNFQMLANPFGQPLAVAGITAAGGALQGGVVQAYEPDGATFVTLGLAGDAVPDVLAVWQGAFAELVPTAVGGAVTVTYAAAQTQTGTTPPFYGKTATVPPTVALSLSGTLASGQTVQDRAAVVRLVDGTEAGWDALDASKLTPPDAAHALVAPVAERGGAAYRLAVDSRPLTEAASVPLAFTATEAGTFALSWTLAGQDSLAALPQGWTATLADLATGETVEIAPGGSYAFEAAAGAWSERFVLTLAPRGATAGDGDAAQTLALAAARPNPTTGAASLVLSLPEASDVRVAAYDVLGREVAVLAEGQLPAGQTTVRVAADALATGTYVVRATVGSQVLTQRLTVVR